MDIRGFRLIFVMFLVFAAAAIRGVADDANPMAGLRGERWNFKFKDFPIGAFEGPAATDAQYQLYKQCGFNVVITPRYLHYKGYDKVKEALDLARKQGLAAVMETYTHHVKPWGGKAGQWHRHRSHHPATLPELKWIHQRYGNHPALIGYMLADDVGNLPAPIVETTKWMRENTPHLWPWVCQLTLRTGSLARAGNPLVIPQLYATLYKSHYPPVNRMQYYCGQISTLRQCCLGQGLLPMPMFNVSTWGKPIQSDSIVRFQIYASIAYGAQGIWYFTYAGYGSLFNGKPAKENVPAVKALCDVKWYVARQANHRVAAWGPELLWRECSEIYHSRWDMWHKKDDEKALAPGKSNIEGPGNLVAKMPDDLLVGILRKQGAAPLAMVVDKRVRDDFRGIPPREVEIVFADTVKSIDVLEAGGSTNVKGKTVKLNLDGGDGQLLKLNEDTGEHKDEPAKAVLPKRMRDLVVKPEMLVGRWLHAPTGSVLTYRNDGTFDLKDRQGKQFNGGRWSVDNRSIVCRSAEPPFKLGDTHPILDISSEAFIMKDKGSTTAGYSKLPD